MDLLLQLTTFLILLPAFRAHQCTIGSLPTSLAEKPCASFVDKSKGITITLKKDCKIDVSVKSERKYDGYCIYALPKEIFDCSKLYLSKESSNFKLEFYNRNGTGIKPQISCYIDTYSKDVPPKKLLKVPSYVRLTESKGNYLCGGTLISNKFVLTTAHCAKPSKINITKVDFVEYNRDGEPKYLYRNISAIYRHDSNNSIALYKLKQPIPETAATKPIKLYNGKTPFPENKTVSTTGDMINHHQTADRFKEIFSISLSNEKCQAAYENRLKIDNNTLCASTNGTSLCRNDFGGPVINVEDKSLVGLVKFVGGTICNNCTKAGVCQKEPADVFIRLSPFIKWIKDTMAKNP